MLAAASGQSDCTQSIVLMVATKPAAAQPFVIPRECGVSSTLRPIDSITDVSGILDRPPSRAMTNERIPAARCVRAVLEFSSPPKIRGRREGRVLAGTRGLVCNEQSKTHTSIQVSAGASGLPCAMVLRLITRSPWRRIPLASIADELTIRRSPVGLGKSPPA
jgi:hypothetical protein